MAAAERAKMATIEKLMVQIFDHKSRILDLVREQTRLFDHHLASKLLLDGIAPPPWLLHPDLPSRTSDGHKELKTEDLISEVLLSRRRPVIPFTNSLCSLYDKPVAEATTGQLPNCLCTEEVCAENIAYDKENKSSALPGNYVADAGCASVGVSTLDHCTVVPEDRRDEDPSITSPQDQRDTRISDGNHDLALSLARLHRSRSRQRALELRNSAKGDKCRLEDGTNLSGCSHGNNGSAVPFLQVEQLEEIESVKLLDTDNVNCAVEDDKIGDTWSKKQGSRNDSREVTRSSSPRQQERSMNVGSSSKVIRESGVLLTDSVGPPIQQSNHGNLPLELVRKSPVAYQSCGERELGVGEKRGVEKGSSNDFRRITRSKSSNRQSNCVTELFKPDGSCDNHRESGKISPARQAQLFDRGETLKSANIIYESAGLKRVTDNYSGKITRSRNSRQPCNTVYDMSKPVRLSSGKENFELCVASGIEQSTTENSGVGYISRSNESQFSRTIENVPKASYSSINRHMSAEKSLPILEDQEPFAANSTDASEEENNVDECIGRNTRTEPLFTAEQTSELVNSQDLARRVTRSRSAALHKPLETKLLSSSLRIGCKVSGVDVKDLPCTSTSQPANVEGCPAIVKENEIVPDGPVEAHPVCLGSNSDGVTELQVFSPCINDTSMPVEPKQLNFDDIEASSFNEISAHTVEKKSTGRLLEKSPSALLESAGMLDKAMAENNQENDRISLEESVDFGKKEEPQRDSSEVQGDDKTMSIIALDQHVFSPVKETAHVDNDIVAYNLQPSDDNSKRRSSLTGNLVTIQAARESTPGSLPKEVTLSNLSDVNSRSGMDLSLVIETGTLIEAKPAELVSNDSELETFSADHELSKDADFPQVKIGPCTNHEACEDHAVELPCAVSKDESMGNLAQSTVNSDMSQRHTVEALDRSIHEDASIHCSQSGQHQITAKSAAKTFFVGGILPRNKRKRSDLLDTLSNSPGTIANVVLPVNKDCEVRDSLNEERCPKDILESQDLQLSQEDVVQSVISGSKVEELPLIEEHSMLEGSKSSPKLQVETADFSLEERDRITNASFTFVNEELEAHLFPSETRHAAEACEGHLMEETRDDGPAASTIYDGEFQCSLEENGSSYHLEEKVETGDSESLTDGEASTQEDKFDPVGTSSLGSPYSPSLYLTGAHETMPVFESFIMQSDYEQSCSADEGISLDKLKLSNAAIERASILEQLCKSACMQTPVSFSSGSCKLHKLSDLYQSVPTGLLEGTDMKDKLPINEEISHPSHARSHSDCLPSTTGYRDWDIKKPCLSPVQKVWDKIIKSGSSGKRRSLIPELPCINEENENGEEVAETYQEGVVLDMLTSSVNREPLAEINANLPESEVASYADRLSLESVSTEFSFKGTHNKAKKNPGTGRSIQRRYNNKENEPLGATSLKEKPGSLHNQLSKPKFSAKSRSRKGGQSIAETETKRSNIVSNITSFIPLVQQKQAPAVVTGKRDVKVKALEAAEAAKRAAEKKENERKLKKEAIKLERARLEQENMRQLELQKKKKEEERKKKEAEMAAKKRQREEGEKKEKERKRLRIDEARKQQQKEHEQKLQAAKEEKKGKGRNMGEKGHEMRESKDETGNYKMEIGKGDDNCPGILEAEPTTTQASTSDDKRAGIVLKDFEASSDVGDSLKVNNLDKQTRTENLVATTSQEQSYDISPYKCSEDEDEEDDDAPNGKFVPSWASKNRIALAVFSQDRVDPAVIFPTESFCSIAEVILPRRFQIR